MKRLRLTAVLMLVSAIVAFAPIAAQNTPTPQTAPAATKHAMDLEDILAFRAPNATSLSPNGQWVAYRMSPLEGDSEVIVKGTAPGGKETKVPVGENGGAFTFSQDSAWIAITTQPTRREAQANTRARRPNQTGVVILNLATGEKTTVPKIRRYAFSGESAGWIALHRYGPDAAPGAAAPAAAAGRGGGGG
ncbi:MAG TPA: hypothetical protein VJN96_01845, partial [Vicinamibacterales bacterium]|nr:hypothetical protein [Vicinamibacterales bacterium]